MNESAHNSIDWSAVRGVTFDVGGTMIKPWPSVGHVYASEARTHGVEAVPEDLNRRFARAWQSRQSFGYSQAEWFEIVRETFGPEARLLPDAFFPQVYNRFRQADAWHVFEDVQPVLKVLANAGMRLGVISNWDDRLPPLLETLGLHHAFAAIVVSCEVGVTKPAPAIFRAAANRLGLEAREILHVGDAIREDLEGARQAGFGALHVDRKGGLDLRALLAPLFKAAAIH